MSSVGNTPAVAQTTALGRLFEPVGAIAGLMARFSLAVIFFKSGLTKWSGFMELSPSAVYLFENEFKVTFLGTAYGFPYPDIMAHVAGTAEIVLPILLVIGLFTRFAALGLFAMTVVIFLVYPTHWPNEQLPWAAMALSLVAYGAGKISLDYLFARKTG